MAKAVRNADNVPRPARRTIRMVQAYKNVFESAEGRLVLADLMNKCFLGKTTFRGDVNEALVNEGARTTLLYIIGMLGMDMEQLMERINSNAQTLSDIE